VNPQASIDKAGKCPETRRTRGLIVLVLDRVRVGTGTGRGGREQVAEAPGVGNGELLPEVVGEPHGGPRSHVWAEWASDIFYVRPYRGWAQSSIGFNHRVGRPL
jgi:hypothetical protein